MDVNMPRMDGFQCLREIKKDKQLKHIPVVMYSTAQTPELKQLASSLGAVDFIKKHIKFQEIVQCITELVTRFELTA